MGAGRAAGPAWACVGLVCLAPGCDGGASADPGLGALLRVQGAQFVPGAPPAAASAGPVVSSILFPTTTIWPGLADKAFSGALDPAATAVAVDLGGDSGYWIVAAGVPDFAAPTLPSFRGTASFSAALAAGAYTFEARAVNAAGDFGAAATVRLVAEDGPPSAPPPQGALVVTLAWDTEADLDLHVVDPSGTEIDHGNPSSAPPPGSGAATGADGGAYGFLDFDSNAGCVIDGLRREDVVWPASPPPGTYLVRVDTPQLCGQPIANFTVHATLEGRVVGAASGVSVDSDTWGAHDHGAGRLLLTFDVP